VFQCTKMSSSKSISCYSTSNNWSSTKQCNGTVSSCCPDLSPSLLHYFSFLLYCSPLLLSQYSSSVVLGGGLPTLCTAEESFLSVCLIHFRSLICTPTGFSCACLHTSSFEPITIRNILCDRINPCLNPGITGKGAVHFPPCTI
jgi:hypothetical protein